MLLVFFSNLFVTYTCAHIYKHIKFFGLMKSPGREYKKLKRDESI
jgi:hypothetical protein